MDPGDDQLKMYGLVQSDCTKQYSVRATYFGPRKEKVKLMAAVTYRPPCSRRTSTTGVGNIPRAVNLPREDLVDLASGTWRSADELRQIFADANLKQD
jgi:3-mercaptopyruvate sulfurtransferase SseA